jgi:F-type H+-transporting ATPase subunit b
MDQTLKALGAILLNAIPTFLLILLLHFYLKSVFFKPLEKALKDRDEATRGARQRAQDALARAEGKARQFEETIRERRGELYREQEELRRQMRQEQESQLAEAAAGSKAEVESYKAQIMAETEAARQALEAESRVLAARIAAGILQGRPS